MKLILPCPGEVRVPSQGPSSLAFPVTPAPQPSGGQRYRLFQLHFHDFSGNQAGFRQAALNTTVEYQLLMERDNEINF
jgi:hypothetical protein